MVPEGRRKLKGGIREGENPVTRQSGCPRYPRNALPLCVTCDFLYIPYTSRETHP